MRADKVILGENCIYSTDSNVTGINNNIVVCGGSGSGKTMSISEPRLLETYNNSLVATVTKRRLVHKYSDMFKKRGYLVIDLNFIEPETSNYSYDPLYYVKDHTDVTFLAQSIVMADKRKDKSNADPYWDKAAVSLLSALIEFTRIKIKNASFADVLLLYDKLVFCESNSSIQTNFDESFKALEEENPSSFAVSCWKSFKMLPIRTASCVFGTLNTTIDTIFSPELRHMISNKNKINFEQIATEKTVLFVTTSAVNPMLHCFVNMFYSQIFKQLFEFAEKCPNGKLPIPVHMLCDDFATGCRILNFPEYISIFREKQISVTMLLQSESQLESIYGSNETQTILNNCDTYIYLGGMDTKTARSISEKLDVPLNDVLWMPIGKEILFRRGQKPIVTQRYNVLENEIYKKITKDYEEKVR